MTLPWDFMRDLTCQCDLRRQPGGDTRAQTPTFMHVSTRGLWKVQNIAKTEDGVFLLIFEKNPQYIYSQLERLQQNARDWGA